MAKGVFRRYLWLVDTIRQAKDGITFEQINRKWKGFFKLNLDGSSLAKKTFHNWLNSLPEEMGVEVECTKSYPYKYFIAWKDDENKELMEWTLNAFSMGNIMAENKHLHGRIMLEDIPSAGDTLETISSAMRNNHEIWMRHKSFKNYTAKELEVKPYALRLCDRRWYLVAYNNEKQEVYTYGLDRILEVRELDRTFEMDREFSVRKKFESCIGVFDIDAPVETVRLKISGNMQNYVKTLPIHQSQVIEAATAEYTIFSYQLKQNYELINRIMSIGADCEVLEPHSLREKIKDEAMKIAHNY